MKYVIMGVSGCGKSSVGEALSRTIGAPYIDGDDLHPAANIAKMSAGIPLDDEDRQPWLQKVGETLANHPGPVLIGCSALKRRYRDLIRTAAGEAVTFIHLSGSKDLIAGRMSRRSGHFMPGSLLDSQFAALEPPDPGEKTVTVSIDQPLQAIVAEIAGAIQGGKA